MLIRPYGLTTRNKEIPRFFEVGYSYEWVEEKI